MASDGYQCRTPQKDVNTLTPSRTHAHTRSQLTGAKDIVVGVKFFVFFFFFSSLLYQNLKNNSDTVNTECGRIHKLHVRTHTQLARLLHGRSHESQRDNEGCGSPSDFPSPPRTQTNRQTNKRVSPNPLFLQEWFLKPRGKTLLLSLLLFHVLLLRVFSHTAK